MAFSLSVADVAFAICARTSCLEPLSNVFAHTYLKHVANSSMLVIGLHAAQPNI